MRHIGIGHTHTHTHTSGDGQWNALMSVHHPTVLPLWEHWKSGNAHVLVYPMIDVDRSLENEISKMSVSDRIQVGAALKCQTITIITKFEFVICVVLINKTILCIG